MARLTDKELNEKLMESLNITTADAKNSLSCKHVSTVNVLLVSVLYIANKLICFVALTFSPIKLLIQFRANDSKDNSIAF